MDFTCSQFLAPLPKANHATTVVSTARHWTNYLFPKVEPSGMEGILSSPYLKQRWADGPKKCRARCAHLQTLGIESWNDIQPAEYDPWNCVKSLNIRPADGSED